MGPCSARTFQESLVTYPACCFVYSIRAAALAAILNVVALIVWLIFVVASVMAGVALWVSEHPLRTWGLGVLLLSMPALYGFYLYRQHLFGWVIGVSACGIIIQMVLMKK